MTTTLTLRPKRLKCRVRSDFFFFDYRNEHHPHYCGKLACRKASKLASERRWLRCEPIGSGRSTRPTLRGYDHGAWALYLFLVTVLRSAGQEGKTRSIVDGA